MDLPNCRQNLCRHSQQRIVAKDFARLVGTSEAAVSKWIGGGHNFTLATLARIGGAGVEMIKV
jgi:transcriptional regulator with XRE-family HTH domain